jgi:large subunit ribosomal protein L10
MDREQKTAVVEELATELKDSAAIFAVDYRGISVPQAAELRASLRDADARFRVVKNRLTLRAADEAGTDGLKDLLSGPTALALVKGDAALAAKTLNRLGSEWELLEYKGGLMDGEALDPDSFKTIARLPGREALNAQLAGVVASPLTGLVRGLGSMIQGLALQLGQIAEQGLVTGEPPKEETPKEDGAPAAAADSEGSDDEAGGGEDAPSDDEAEAPAAEESPADPDPTDSPEETSEEKAPEGEEAGQAEPSETGEGDQDIGEEPAAEESPGGTEDAGGDEDSGTDEDTSEDSEDSDQNKEDAS